MKALINILKNKLFGLKNKHKARRLYKKSRPVFSNAGKILFWVPGGMPLMLHVEGAIAMALKLRGVPAHAVICDGVFKACVRREITDGMVMENWHKSCPGCKADTSSVLESMGIEYSCIGDFVSAGVLQELREKTANIQSNALEALSYKGINVGKNVNSAILRYLKGNSLNGNEKIVSEYAFSGLVTAAAAESAFSIFSPERVFISHGTYVDWGPALHVALSNKISVTAWMASYLTACFYFRHIDDSVRIDFHNMSHTAWNECKGVSLSPLQESRLDSFFRNRYKKQISFDMKKFNKTTDDIDALRKSYVSLSGKPVWGIISHINWDAVADYSPMAYETFDEWILDTIREIIQITDVNWIVKIHPAESWDNPKSGVQELILKNFPSLPLHIRVISFDEDISPFDFFQMVDGGITVYGTAGLEIALQGKPVILAGEAHYGGKGFTYDGLNPDTYRKLLRRAGTLKPLSEEQRQLARRYAYCYFIQRQVPFPVVKDPKSTWWKFQYKKRHLLLPGKDPFVDFICDRIMDGKDFIMDERLVTLSEKIK